MGTWLLLAAQCDAVFELAPSLLIDAPISQRCLYALRWPALAAR